MSKPLVKAALLGAALLAGAVVPAQAAPTPAEATASQRLWFGAAWYPEQWPESRWDADLALMQAAGVNVVRVGEFAWSALEPSEGRYDLDWLARAVRAAERRHIAVVIGTPTDAPPAWLTRAYPEVLRIGADGKRAEHGGRRQFSYSSPKYRALCRDIVARLAARFGHDPDVIGWQIGNEYTDESFDPATRAQFQAWLKAKYQTLDALNAAWTTAYWSQTYDAWDEIPLNGEAGNPGLMLDHRRFVTDTWVSFQQAQLDVLKTAGDPRQFTTTNIGGLGWSDNWDHYAVTRPLSLASWDPYVGQGQLDPYRNGAVSDFVRGWKRRNFWVMETQPGFVNWAPVNTSLERGAVRAMAWEDVGHGADAVLYWQWRSALNGQEQYHGALVGPDGGPLPLYAEAQQTGREFARASTVLAGTAPQSQVAILHSYPSRWAIDFQLHSQDYDQLKVLLDVYRPLEDALHSVDVVEADAPLDRYKAVFAPSLNVIPDALAAHLLDYVRRGGRLVLGPRAGMKDGFDRLDTHRQPGPLAAALGGRVEQYYALDAPVAVVGAVQYPQSTPSPLAGEGGDPRSGEDEGSLDGGVKGSLTPQRDPSPSHRKRWAPPSPARGEGSRLYPPGLASIWAEALSADAPGVRTLLRYGAGGWTSGRPAAIARRYGEGTIVYLGAVLDPELMKVFVDGELKAAGASSPYGALPDGVELMRRTAPGREVVILINHTDSAQDVRLPWAMTDVLAGGTRSQVSLPRQGVAVLERQKGG